MSGPLSFQFGKLIVIAGFVLVVAGLVLMVGSRAGFFGLGRLPGDLSYKAKNFSFYFPVMTCLILSLIGTLILWLVEWLRRR